MYSVNEHLCDTLTKTEGKKVISPTRSYSSGAFGHICWRQVAVSTGGGGGRLSSTFCGTPDSHFICPTVGHIPVQRCAGQTTPIDFFLSVEYEHTGIPDL